MKSVRRLINRLRRSGGAGKSNQCLSAFEQLPPELINRIFAYTPESVFKLRLTCRVLRSRVDAYTILREAIPYINTVHIKRDMPEKIRAHPPLPLMRRITNRMTCGVFETPRLDIDGDLVPEPRTFKVHIFVPRYWKKVFELRLLLVGSPPSLRPKTIRTNNSSDIYSVTVAYGDVPVFECINACIGPKIMRMWLIDYWHPEVRKAGASLLNLLHIDSLEVESEYIDDYLAYNLVEMVNPRQLDLTVRDVHFSDPANLLLNLSSGLRSLRIKQEFDRSLDEDAPFFFGIYNGDWAEIVLKLFSGKMDKLCLYSPYFEDFLDQKNADFIKDKLPTLGKKVWFEATCKAYKYGLYYTMNDFTVKAFSPAANSVDGFWSPRTVPYLAVKHISREREDFKDIRSSSMNADYANYV